MSDLSSALGRHAHRHHKAEHIAVLCVHARRVLIAAVFACLPLDSLAAHMDGLSAEPPHISSLQPR